ncbi:hypothetical protein HNP12_003852 [Aeromonas hydrophila]|nr:hypothetical protein [Aeromonas hydrophila]MCS3793538.1 hypothetical protein [Aeromonas hydrophila]
MLGRLNSSSYAPVAGSQAHAALTALIAREFARHAVDGVIAFNYDTLLYSGRV